MLAQGLKFLTDLQKSEDKLDHEILMKLADSHEYSLNNLRNSLFNLTTAILKKYNKRFLSHFQKMEQLIQQLVKMKIFTNKQLTGMKNVYKIVCDKFGHTWNEGVFDSGSQSESKFLKILHEINEPSTNQCEKVEISKTLVEKFEETKEVIVEKKITTRYEKEFCIICMERSREIVFLPCRHFLSCDVCCVRFLSCPLCSKKLDNKMKIFWS